MLSICLWILHSYLQPRCFYWDPDPLFKYPPDFIWLFDRLSPLCPNLNMELLLPPARVISQSPKTYWMIILKLQLVKKKTWYTSFILPFLKIHIQYIRNSYQFLTLEKALNSSLFPLAMPLSKPDISLGQAMGMVF